MSAINGDKARFHKSSKKKIAKRERKLDLLRLADPSMSSTSKSRSKPPEVKV